VASNIHLFTTNQRRKLIRGLVFLSLIRWYNLLVVALAQYLAAYFILHHDVAWYAVVFDLRLFGVVSATGLVIAGGYIINAFYDMEKDLANRPDEVIIGRVLTKTHAFRGYLLVNGLALLLSLALKPSLVVFNGLFAFGLWFYSHKLKKKPFLGNLAAATLTVAAFFAVCVYYRMVNQTILVYAIFIVLITLVREIVKDLENMKGDLLYGYQTVPVVHGIRRTKQLLYVLIVSGILPFSLLYATKPLEGLLWYFVSCGIMLAITAGWIQRAKRPADFGKVNTLLKILILTGVASIVLL
jgi:4-hydroxybenzoate polyprenyltransferase